MVAQVTAKRIKESLNSDHHVAHRIMAELKAVELVDELKIC